MRLFLRADVERARRDRDQRVGKFSRPRRRHPATGTTNE
jgi:hypothetical protein